MTRMRFLVFILVMTGGAVIAAAARPALAIGGQFGLEFAIDAPWRLEPVAQADGRLDYGPVPITITFHDAIFDDHRGIVSSLSLKQIHVGFLQSIEVMERIRAGPTNPRRLFEPSDLREIERKPWISTPTVEPVHQLCRPIAGEDCRDLLQISESHAWHAMLWYQPELPVVPGRDIHLQVTVNTVHGGEARAFRNYLVVHAGEEPLPRFDDRWIYGDFHYHAQMTDNEGESGYAYRNVVRTIGAMGIDFVFATDHASGGKQADGGITVFRCGNAFGRACSPSATSTVCRVDEPCRSIGGSEARDLNSARFAAAKDILYSPEGANLDILRDIKLGAIANFSARQVVPQVYMGEEVDAWPEMSNAEHDQGVIHFGDGLTYPWPDNDGCIAKDGASKCRKRYSQPYRANDSSSRLVLDKQGVPLTDTVGDELDSEKAADILRAFGLPGAEPHASRQHLIYFPFSGAADGAGFVPSNTTRFGGASRRLEEVVGDIEGQGVTFLAHPLIGRKPGGIAGPDIVPYSRRALNRAWRSPAVLGLQFWNEDTRVEAGPTRRSPIVMGGGSDNAYDYFLPWRDGASLGQFPWHWQRFVNAQRLLEDLYHGAVTWDAFLRKGLIDSQTSSLRWLPRGEPRKWFMAGGSDGHGDFNFRREGRPCIEFDGIELEQWCDHPVVDTAIGKPRNLVLVDRSEPVAEVATDVGVVAKRYSNRQVIEAVRAGRFAVTDGPALRIAIDKNRNGQIDLDDYQMGDTFHLFPGEHVPLLVEWRSTPEFGPVRKVDVYVGTPEATFAHHRPAGAPAFAPLSHGPRDPFDRPAKSGKAYANDPAGVLRIDPAKAGSGGAFAGTARLFIGPEQFNLAEHHGRLFYLRAFAQSDGQVGCATGLEPGSCGMRMAYANPIWGRFIGGCLDDPLALDGDANGRPDICERVLTSPCPTAAHPGTQEMAPPSGPSNQPPLFGMHELEAPSNEVFAGDHPPSPPVKPSPTNSCQFVRAS